MVASGGPMVQEYGFYIGGKWVNPKDRKRFETINPATREVLATFPQATKEDVAAAVKAAKNAFEKWRKTPPPRRGELLLEAAKILRRRKEELGRLVTMEMGKVLAEGRGDVQEVIDFFEYASGEGRRFFGVTVPSELPNKMCFTVRLPVGPVALITPWNFPMAIPGWKSGAALIGGCTVVFKPSSLTPLCGAKVTEVLEEAGFPPGVFNFLVGPGSTVGDAIIAHPDIRAVSFTGGVDTGKQVYKTVAENMKK
ncbi:MAG: aldehyde dehydrogenase family protein, partial [Euryarchaeota archaeon]|nr:aldehyde dehydrogenase family protein [Euryarchaeota archaeon]